MQIISHLYSNIYISVHFKCQITYCKYFTHCGDLDVASCFIPPLVETFESE